MAIEIKSYNQILGEIIRKIVADSPINDINTGSALMSLIEAAAQVDFENNASILSVLELLNIDAVRNNDLDTRAGDFGLTRRPAARSTGFVRITDSTMTKKSSGLYQVKPAPIAGNTVLFVNNAADWEPTGQLFIGRGTPNFEGPISYTSIVDNGSFYTINLASALEKDHLISELVIDAQGTTDRQIPAGTVVQIPSNNQNPTVEFRTLRESVIPAGEDTVDNVNITAVLAGTNGNAGINTIVQFSSPPFAGAAVANTVALTNGRNIETDSQLRERIKSFASTLARGTAPAILAAVIGVSDPDDGKQVESATISEPPVVGDPSILYIDDGTGFQPSSSGQSVDILLSNANGTEEFLQLANYPLPRPQVINTIDAPFEITSGMRLNVIVDDIEETVIFSPAQFINITSATTAEIIVAINNQSELFKATFTENSSRILLYPTAHDAEIIQVSPLREGEDEVLYANRILKFPTNESSYIRLYLNNELLNEKEKAAQVISSLFSEWNINTPGNIILSVDNTPIQNQSFNSSDFGGLGFDTLNLSDWVSAFNSKFAGITAVATASGRLQLVSNKTGQDSSVQILGGSYFDQIFGSSQTSAVGQNSDFQLNRQNGNIRILRDIQEGDTITAGTDDARGSVTSSETLTGSYNLATDSDSRPAELVVVADGNGKIRDQVALTAGQIIEVTDEGSDVMRLTSSSTASFAAVLPGDYIYIVDRGTTSGWIHPDNSGLHKVISKGGHTDAGVDSYIEVKHVGITSGTHEVLASDDIQVFRTDSYPQLWKSSFLSTPASAPILSVISSFDRNLLNVNAEIFKTNSIKLSSSTELNGSIATPAASGNAALLFSLLSAQFGNPPHIASRKADKDFPAFFRRTTPQNTWLGRYTYTDAKGALDTSVVPGIEGVDQYSEELESTGVLNSDNVWFDDLVCFLEGNNKKHYRHIRDVLVGDTIGTQHAIPRTLMSMSSGDRFNVFKSAQLSPDDSIIMIMDQDPVNKTIDVNMSRLGRINSSFIPTDISFSADDADNEPGINFGTLQVWGKSSNNTEFKDYAVWMRARNWYVSGGAGSGGGSMMIRAKEYGPHGEKIRFRMEYPNLPDVDANISHQNNPDFTDVVYVFGADEEKNIGESSGDTFTVTDLGNSIFRYSFTNNLDLSTVVAGDVLSILPDAGVSAANSGQLKIVAVNDGNNTIDVRNPNGSETTLGLPEITDITTIDDIVGSPEIYSIDVNSQTGTDVDGTYFIIEDTTGTVAIWFDTDDSGTPEPAHGADRSIEVNPAAAASSVTLASLISGALGADPAFTASSTGDVVTITNVLNGDLNPVVLGTSGFLDNGGVNGSDDISLDGLYFIIPDQNGTVAFWYNTTGAATEPLHGATRSVEIITVDPGDNAATIASKTAVVINSDAQFSATAAGATITVTDVFNGTRVAASAGDSGFTVVQNQAGVNDDLETIILTTSFMVFELEGTDVDDIVEKISESQLLVAAVIDNTNPITLATRDEDYTPAGPNNYSQSLSYSHDPDPLSLEHNHIKLFDSISWVKDFENTSPHFTLKKALILQGAAPAAYSMESTPNEDTTEGEYFRLVPVTLNNLLHHFTQKALSQLSIVADIDICDAMRRIQIKSKLLGSRGAVEIVGGNANGINLSIAGEAQSDTGPESGNSFTQIRTRAFPVTVTTGDVVRISNSQAARRVSRLTAADTIDVIDAFDTDAEYRWNHKNTNLSSVVKIEITDVSASYSLPNNTVWRWTHSDSGSFFRITDINPGDITTLPETRTSDALSNSSNLVIQTINPGSTVDSESQVLRLGIASLPDQGDYFIISDSSNVVFAIWFDIDGNGTPPDNVAPFSTADHQIQISINSTDTDNMIISALSTALSSNVDFNSSFGSIQEAGATFAAVSEGDIVSAYGSLSSNWSAGNKVNISGDGQVAGLPVIAVDASQSYIDVVNPHGTAMASEAIGSGSISITPTPAIRWNIDHIAKTQVVSANKVGATVTVVTASQHMLKEGDTFTLADNPLEETAIINTVIGPTSFTYTSTSILPDEEYEGGNIIDDNKTQTRYAIEELSFNNIYRLRAIEGNSPRFLDCGVAIDDLMVIGGSTFRSGNNGIFRVIGVDNDSIIYENPAATEELNTIVPVNNLSTPVSWIANFNEVTGSQGAFKNLSIGHWVKKVEDPDERYVQVIALLDASDVPVSPELAVKIRLGSNYQGNTSVSEGVRLDKVNDIRKGRLLNGYDDIRFFEGDSVMAGDRLFVDNIANPNWFSSINSGMFRINQFGTNEVSGYKPFVRVNNPAAVNESNKLMGVSLQGFFILENEDRPYSSVRVVEHSAIDGFNPNRRSIYLSPDASVFKLSQSNGTRISPVGKIGYNTDVVAGIDGYRYYTGLLRRTQRIVDGFEPDPISFPGRRAVGGAVEILPPLIRQITMSIEVATDEGVNLNEISNDIKSAIITYVRELGVGQDVILSEVIVRVMDITGVAAVTFNTPLPSIERIAIKDNERAFILPENISVA